MDRDDTHEGYVELKVNFEEFIKLLDPNDNSFLKKHIPSSNRFIFRGQSDSTYNLLPSIFRSKIEYSPFKDTYENLCWRQFQYLKSFIQGCDFNNSIIPNDSYSFRKNDAIFKDAYHIRSNTWPDESIYELLGFAQHYGHPTELLDWTYNPLVACYFAVSGAIKTENSSSKSLSIWVLDQETIYDLNQYEKNIEIIDMPKSINANISSQEGCFVLIRQYFDRGEKITYPDSLKTIDKLMHEKNKTGLLKISISYNYVPEILNYCYAHRVNAATLFRSPAGAAKYVEDNINILRFKHSNNLKIKGIPV